MTNFTKLALFSKLYSASLRLTVQPDQTLKRNRSWSPDSSLPFKSIETDWFVITVVWFVITNVCWRRNNQVGNIQISPGAKTSNPGVAKIPDDH
mmetsp:Transcript_15320/g.24945  ORF Transcript_15320/g.24945 Transcript_15320/m.24945 type:complete len:94 (+) Transcript_15320:235-516(+)